MPESRDSEKIIIPAKPGHRIVIVSLDVAYYEHVETGARTPIDLFAFRLCECGCGKRVVGGRLEAAHPDDYRDERG